MSAKNSPSPVTLWVGLRGYNGGGMVRGSASGRQETADEDHVEPMFLPDALPAHTIRELDRYWPLLSLGLGNWSEAYQQPNTRIQAGAST